jgi:hypothetical protein
MSRDATACPLSMVGSILSSLPFSLPCQVETTSKTKTQLRRIMGPGVSRAAVVLEVYHGIPAFKSSYN